MAVRLARTPTWAGQLPPMASTTYWFALRTTGRRSDIQISENGAAYDDAPDASGKVADVRRTEYLLSHLDAMGRAIAAGAPVTHYFAWSLLDNFEWAEGYAKRFGLIYVDFNTQQRFVKDSAHAYAAIISNHVQSLASAAS